MQHVRPGSSISSSICFSSAVFVTTWPFSLVCKAGPGGGSDGAATHPPHGPRTRGHTLTLSIWGKDGCAERKPLQLASTEGADPDPPALLSLQEPLKQRKPSGWNPGQWPPATSKAPLLVPASQASAAEGCGARFLYCSHESFKSADRVRSRRIGPPPRWGSEESPEPPVSRRPGFKRLPATY